MTPGGDSFLYRGWQVQQTQRVADVRPGPADLLGELFMRSAEVVKQLLVCGRFFERVKLLPVQVLKQRVAEHVIVGGLPDDGRNVIQPSALARTPAPFAHNELVALTSQAAHHDRLQQSYLRDGRRQLVKRILVKRPPRLPRVRRNSVNSHFFEVSPSHRPQSSVATGAFRRSTRGCGLRRESAPAHPCTAGRTRARRFRYKRSKPLAQSSPLLRHYVSLKACGQARRSHPGQQDEDRRLGSSV